MQDKPLFFVCMNNVLCSNVKIWEKYDLKGSKQGRFQAKRSFTLDTVLKDLDFTRKLLVDEKMKEAIMNQLSKCWVFVFSSCVSCLQRFKRNPISDENR